MTGSLVFGWSAPPFKEQVPQLSVEDADNFDKDNLAIIRLHVRGVLTDAHRDAAIRKVHLRIAAAVLRRPK